MSFVPTTVFSSYVVATIIAMIDYYGSRRATSKVPGKNRARKEQSFSGRVSESNQCW